MLKAPQMRSLLFVAIRSRYELLVDEPGVCNPSSF